ncbi:hypothetical protein D9602_21500, partial [Sphingomonas sp. TX0522]|nr:hypothetical protein [Sphingomonas sp. TX0522]
MPDRLRVGRPCWRLPSSGSRSDCPTERGRPIVGRREADRGSARPSPAPDPAPLRSGRFARR